ncbi:FAD-dependent monooxygenase [Phenylobacterium parvum]|uniref:Monooxygenase n=1 Tax=Phenylobacterium parvum TaxID=2201350 RepID=A0A2Z3HVL4_9CAUL|nr:FAD-dependent monooxygenase [Phenylobacterium parvum]AWM76819.1 monooxygenase [Phenylobacterium parvum]
MAGAAPPPPLTALVVGAGVGGLTTALALARTGVAVTVVEQAGTLGEVGAGLQVSPNASRALFSLGLEAGLSAQAFRPEAVEARGWRRGQTISRAPLGDAALQKYGFPYLHMHRADLVAVLGAACEAEPRITLRLGQAVAACPRDGTPALVLASGERLEADVLVGADGIRSLVRQALFGPAAPRFTGNVAWRGLVPAEKLKEAGIGPVASLWMGPGAHFVHYYVRGGTLVNFVGVVERDDWREESWSSRGTAEDLRRDFAGWHPTVRRIVEAAPEDACFRWALFDRDPLPKWSRGAVTLLGDACHPTLPFMAQGACMAIEDAAVLAACLSGRAVNEVPAALERYEALRRPRTAAIQAGSRRNAAIYHLRPPFSWARNLAMQAGLGMGSTMDDLYSYDALAAAGEH